MPWKVDLGSLGKIYSIITSANGANFHVSEDGQNWSNLVPAVSGYSHGTVGQLNGNAVFCAYSTNEKKLLYTEDTSLIDVNYFNNFLPAGFILKTLAYANGWWLRVYENTNSQYQFAISQDLVNWTIKRTTSASEDARYATVNPGYGSFGFMVGYHYRVATVQSWGGIKLYNINPDGSDAIVTINGDASGLQAFIGGSAFIGQHMLAFKRNNVDYLRYGGATVPTEITVPNFFRKFIETSNGILGAGQNGIHKSYGDITSWVFKQAGNFYDVVDMGDNRFVAIGLSGLIMYSDDEGETWINITHGLGTPTYDNVVYFSPPVA